MSREQLSRWMGIVSILGGIGWMLCLTVSSAENNWGPSGTTAYGTYETINRLMGVAIAFMGVGVAGVYIRQYPLLRMYDKIGFLVLSIGVAAMLAGNVAEFWIFTDLPYEPGNLREFAWITFAIGSLFVLIGALLTGVSIWRVGVFPPWSALIFAFTLPLGIASIIFGFLLWVRQWRSKPRNSSN